MGEIAFRLSTSKALVPPSIRSSSQINLVFNIPSTAVPPKISTLSCRCFDHSFPKPIGTSGAASSFRNSTPTRVPARDTVIDFGKYKGKMLGSLPSNYLKWISRHLRAGDTVKWAKLADEVLSDPVYRDRIEWEFAEKILSGDSASASRSSDGNAVSALLEISEKFGWDNEDKIGWSKIDFALLGTSKGGRIPRVGARSNVETESLKKEKAKVEAEMEGEDGGRRRERRERMRQRRLETSGAGRMGNLGDRGSREEMNDDEEDDPRPVVGRTPFPGREALLNKVINRRRLKYQ